jgi:hypothetical protein
MCDSCGGCLECKNGYDPECPDCGNAPVAVNESYYPDILDIDEDLLPLFDLFGTPIFFFAPVGMPSWAILSVLLTIAGVVISIFTILCAIRQKKTENINVDNQCSAMVRNVDSFNNDVFIDLIKHKEQYNNKRRLAALILMYVLSIGALVILLIIQNFRGVIAIFDRVTIIHAILLIGIIVCCTLVFRKYESFPKSNMPAASSP